MPATRRAPRTAPRAVRKGRAVREPLSRERIVQVALEQVHRDGLAQLSTRRLGQELGCEAMSIYHHFPSKAHLLDALVDHATATVELPGPDLPPEERLRKVCYAYRAMAHRFPALFPLVAVHRHNTPTGVRFIDAVIAIIQDLEPDREAAARQFRTVGYYLVGACLDETSGYAKGPSAAEPVSDAYIAEHCPALVSAAPYFKSEQWDATFELGLRAMMDSFGRDAPRPPAAAKTPSRPPQR
ncbi:MAG TPA: TetR/AcrR family transcriptional regulator [Burkholderiaceae bacterium]|nr:TetR/AcrR family transcriptional regulator [Burkholderiaceae bacterium]